MTCAISPTPSSIDWTCAAVSQSPEPASCGAEQGSGELDTTVTLPMGAQANIVVRVRVPETMTGDVQAQVNVAVLAGLHDRNLSNNSATATTPIEPASLADDQMAKLSGGGVGCTLVHWTSLPPPLATMGLFIAIALLGVRRRARPGEHDREPSASR